MTPTAHTDSTIALLKRLVTLQSIYPKEGTLGRFLYDYFKSHRYRVYKQLVGKNRFNIIVEKGQGDKVIGLYSHLDTVPVALGWTKSPFDLTIQGDKAYGLGAYDMKSGMVANILTFLQFKPKNIKLRLLLCVDEENISKGSYKLMDSKYADALACVISTEPGFTYGLQGLVTGRPGRAVFIMDF